MDSYGSLRTRSVRAPNYWEMADLQQASEMMSDEADLSSENDPDFSENEEEQENISELQNMEEQQRYRRLQHLLEKSSIYSMFLLQRMNNQKEEEKRKHKNHKKSRAKKFIGEDTKQAKVSKTYSLRRKRQASEVAISPSKQETRSKRKRKGCSDTNYKIEDYVDKEVSRSLYTVPLGEAPVLLSFATSLYPCVQGHLKKNKGTAVQPSVDTSFSQEEDDDADEPSELQV